MAVEYKCTSCGKTLPVSIDIFAKKTVQLECPFCHVLQTLSPADGDLFEDVSADEAFTNRNSKELLITQNYKPHNGYRHFLNYAKHAVLGGLLIAFVTAAMIFYKVYQKKSAQTIPVTATENASLPKNALLADINKRSEDLVVEEQNIIPNDLADESGAETHVSEKDGMRSNSLENVNQSQRRPFVLPSELRELYAIFNPQQLNKEKDKFVQHQKQSPDDIYIEIALNELFYFLGARMNEPSWIGFADKRLADLTLSKGLHPYILELKAFSLFVRQDWNRAFEVLKSKYHLLDNSHLARGMFGRLTFLKQNQEKGIAILKQAQKDFPKSYFIKEQLALNYLDRGEYKLAQVIFEKLIVTNAQDALLRYSMGMVEKHLGNWNQSAKHFSQVDKSHPLGSNAQLELSEVLIQQEHFLKARTHLIGLIENKRLNLSNVDKFRVFLNLGKVALHLQKFPESIQWLRKAEYILPQNVTAKLLLAENFESTQDYQLENQKLIEAATLQPTNNNIQKRLALSLIRIGEYQKAYKELGILRSRLGLSFEVIYYQSLCAAKLNLKSAYEKHLAEINTLELSAIEKKKIEDLVNEAGREKTDTNP